MKTNQKRNLASGMAMSAAQGYRLRQISGMVKHAMKQATNAGSSENQVVIPERNPRSKVEGALEVSSKEETSEEISKEGTSEGASKEETSEGTSKEETSEGTPEETSEGTSERASKETSEGIPEETSEGTPEETSEGTSERASKETSEGIPEETSEETTMENYLREHYELRYNLLTEMTEYRKRIPDSSGENTPPINKVLDQRESNTLFIQLQKAGVKCSEHELLRYLHSSFIHPYHPFRYYLEHLPAWDRSDRITDLASRVSTDDSWIHHFHRWMLALTAQWMGLDTQHANSTAPLLISDQQGWMKSTFCQSLMPQSLRPYYTDQLDLARNFQDRKLAVMGLINLDEFDRLSPRHMAQLKNLMQLSALNLKKAYKQNFQQLPRIASFIGTSNRLDLLTDPTGSRRFICVKVEKPIDCTHLDIDQIYAQLVTELQTGVRYWFSHEEEAQIQAHNASFYQTTPEEELFRAHFRAPSPEEAGEYLSLDEILGILQQNHKGLMRNLNLNRFGSAIVAAGVERKHTRVGNRYKVVEIK